MGAMRVCGGGVGAAAAAHDAEGKGVHPSQSLLLSKALASIPSSSSVPEGL